MPFRQLSRYPLVFGDGINWSFALLDFEENMNALAQALSCKTIAVFGATGEIDIYVEVPSSCHSGPS